MMAQALDSLTVADESIADPDASAVLLALEDSEEFGAIYVRYMPRVYRYMRTRSGSREEAADLTQLVFVRALKALPSYRPERAPFSAWLFRIARNASTDAKRRRRATIAWDDLPEPTTGTLRHDPEAAALRREQLARLRDSSTPSTRARGSCWRCGSPAACLREKSHQWWERVRPQ